MGDPIDKQKAIVSAMTQGKVEWTLAHREALLAAMEKRKAPHVPARIWRDVHRLLAVLVGQLKNPSQT